jgi:uncharacterized protein
MSDGRFKPVFGAAGLSVACRQRMVNPLRMKSWSPYVVGAALGVLSWFAFATADKHLAITLQFEHASAFAQKALAPEAAQRNPYYAAREADNKGPRISWELMLIVGVFVGSWLSGSLSGDRARTTVPPLWRSRFGERVVPRYVVAFLGGAVMVLGARLAGGCTSGHGISGTLQLAVSSWIFISLAFVVAITTAFALFGTEGRQHV